MMQIMKYTSFFIFFSVIVHIFINISTVSAGGPSDQDDSTSKHIIVTAHNVGQGNCISVEFPQEESSEWMIVDCGTSSFAKEAALTETFKRSSHSTSSSLPEHLDLSKPPLSTTRASGIRKIEKEKAPLIKKFKQKQKKRFIADLRRKILSSQHRSSETCSSSDYEDESDSPPDYIRVKTVVITHPDIDHYGWIQALFKSTKDTIDHLVLCGHPLHYDMSGRLKFREWLNERFEEGTMVYFPTVSRYPFTKQDELEDLLSQEDFSYQEAFFGRLDHKGSDKVDFGDAFSFSGSRIDILALNAMYFSRNSEKVEKWAEIDDDNVDSIVLQVFCGESSAILTGDATGLVTKAIMDVNHARLEQLEANVLLASHHGSSTHETNDPVWIRATNPEYIFISNGHTQGHPTLETYEACKKAERLQTMKKRHRIIVGREGFSEGKEMLEDLHKTHKAIYSTLTNDSLEAYLYSDGTTLIKTNGKDRYVTFNESKKGKKDTVKEGIFVKKGESLQFVSTPQKNIKKIRKKISFSETDSPDKSESSLLPLKSPQVKSHPKLREESSSDEGETRAASKQSSSSGSYGASKTSRKKLEKKVKSTRHSSYEKSSDHESPSQVKGKAKKSLPEPELSASRGKGKQSSASKAKRKKPSTTKGKKSVSKKQAPKAQQNKKKTLAQNDTSTESSQASDSKGKKSSSTKKKTSRKTAGKGSKT